LIHDSFSSTDVFINQCIASPIYGRNLEQGLGYPLIPL
jgi:hypothetical protein